MGKMVKDTKRGYSEDLLADPNHPYEFGELWSTLDGQTIPIINLRDSHLANIIEHVKDRDRGQEILPYLIEEKKRRRKAELAKKSKMGKVLYGHKKN